MEEKKREQEEKGRVDNTLLELSVGVVCWTVLCQVIGVWFVQDKISYSIGLWCGGLIAVAAGIHMWWGLNKALNFSQNTVVRLTTKYNILRYLLIAVALALIIFSGIANPLAAFLALIGLKIAAYAQPFTHKVCSRFYKE